MSIRIFVEVFFIKSISDNSMSINKNVHNQKTGLYTINNLIKISAYI